MYECMSNVLKMSSIINQKEYLKKYLGLGKHLGDKKKKKKKDKTTDTRFKVIDDDVDLALSREIQEDISALNEDAPQIVAVIDERPPSLRIDETTKSKLWKPIGEPIDLNTDTGFRISSFQLKKPKGSNDLELQINKSKFKHYESDKKNRDKSLSSKDLTPPRNKSKNVSSPRKLDDFIRTTVKSEDFSPPRKHLQKKRDYDDSSPPRRIKNEDISPPRRRLSSDSSQRYKTEDLSPPRKTTEVDLSPPRKKYKNLSPARKDYSPRKRRSEDLSPPRKKEKHRDLTPPRRREYKDSSPPRRYSDLSPRKKRGESDISPDFSKKIKREKSESVHTDSDLSPPRRNKHDVSPEIRGKKNKDVDQSPRRKHKDDVSRKSKRESSESPYKNSDKDLSPPKKYKNKDLSPQRKKRETSESPHRQRLSRWSDRSPESSRTPERVEKTLSGKKAGLQSAKDTIKELIALKEKEEEAFKKMSEELSGKNAATVVRGQKPKDHEKEVKDLKKEKEMKEKYDRWGKGLKQVQDENEKMLDQINEMNKPLARYADDEDLERYLKEQEREGDPMLAYIRKKKKKKIVEAGIPEKPMYMGEFLPNRFGIRPGYRWDGVDRSSGYEKKWFETHNARKAVQEEAFRWSTEDM